METAKTAIKLLLEGGFKWISSTSGNDGSQRSIYLLFDCTIYRETEDHIPSVIQDLSFVLQVFKQAFKLAVMSKESFTNKKSED